MTGILQFGSFLLSYLWIVAAVAAAILIGAAIYLGRDITKLLRVIVEFFRSPIGQMVAFGAVIYIAMCVGFNWADGICDAKQLREQLESERKVFSDRLAEIKSQNDAAIEDAKSASFNEGIEHANQQKIDSAPVIRGSCLDRGAADRVFDIR